MSIFRHFHQLLYRDYPYVIGEEIQDTFYELTDKNPNIKIPLNFRRGWGLCRLIVLLFQLFPPHIMEYKLI